MPVLNDFQGLNDIFADPQTILIIENITQMADSSERILSIQSHVVSGYVALAIMEKLYQLNSIMSRFIFWKSFSFVKRGYLFLP